jgi:hypothetical protein
MLGSSPALGCSKCLVPGMLRELTLLREVLKQGCDPVVNRKASDNPSNSI